MFNALVGVAEPSVPARHLSASAASATTTTSTAAKAPGMTSSGLGSNKGNVLKFSNAFIGGSMFDSSGSDGATNAVKSMTVVATPSVRYCTAAKCDKINIFDSSGAGASNRNLNKAILSVGGSSFAYDGDFNLELTAMEFDNVSQTIFTVLQGAAEGHAGSFADRILPCEGKDGGYVSHCVSF